MSAQVAQSLMNRGLSKPNLYTFRITRNANTDLFDANEFLSYYCKSVSLPEISQDVIVSNGHFRQGIVTQQASGYKYGKPLEITVVERSDYHAYRNLKRWFMKSGEGINSDFGGQRMSYKNEYTADIELVKLEQPDGSFGEKIDNFKIVWTARFVNAYISSLGAINYSSEARDAMVEFSAEFYFDNYVIDFEDD